MDIRSNDRGVSAEFAGATIEKSKIHDNEEGIGGSESESRGDVRIVDNEIVNNERDGINAFRWWPLFIERNLIKGNGGTGAELYQSHASVLDNTFDGNGGDGLSISDCVTGHLDFFRVGANLARKNGGLGMSVNFFCTQYQSSDLLDAGGNAASRNGNPQECTPPLVCSKDRGQAKKLMGVSTAQHQTHDD
jgi:hypothetical protein